MQFGRQAVSPLLTTTISDCRSHLIGRAFAVLLQITSVAHPVLPPFSSSAFQHLATVQGEHRGRQEAGKLHHQLCSAAPWKCRSERREHCLCFVPTDFWGGRLGGRLWRTTSYSRSINKALAFQKTEEWNWKHSSRSTRHRLKKLNGAGSVIRESIKNETKLESRSEFLVITVRTSLLLEKINSSNKSFSLWLQCVLFIMAWTKIITRHDMMAWIAGQ